MAHPRPKAVRRFGYGHHGEIAAVAAAHHRYFFWIEIAGLYDPIGSGDHVVQIAAAQIKTVGILKFLSVSG